MRREIQCGEYKYRSTVECDVTRFGRQVPTFRRNLLTGSTLEVEEEGSSETPVPDRRTK
jgi:hypothetical protein